MNIIPGPYKKKYSLIRVILKMITDIIRTIKDRIGGLL